MKKTLIVAATFEELEPTFTHFGWSKANLVETPLFDVLITGVGMTATAFALGKHLNSSHELVLNVGIAGSFDRTITLGSLVNITSDTFSELGAQDGKDFIAIDELGFGKSEYSTSFIAANKLIKDLPTVAGITVNNVHGETKSIQTILERLDIKTESMEGAAVFYACEHLNISVAQIRSISNYIEQRNKEKWEIALALKKLNDWLINYLNTNFAL